MDSRHHDVARWLFHKLEDTLAEVRFDHVYTLFYKIFVQVALLRKHGFALHEFFDAMITQNAIQDLVVLLGVLSPMDDDTVATSIFFKSQ